MAPALPYRYQPEADCLGHVNTYFTPATATDFIQQEIWAARRSGPP